MSRPLDPLSNRKVSESTLHFLLIELVDYFLRGHGALSFTPPSDATQQQHSSPDPVPPQSASADQLSILSAKRKRIEALGHDIGTRLVERYVMERDRLEADLDIVKFICKDFWEHTFKKQIDVLRTNHRGLYVLTDNNFRWLSHVSISDVEDAKSPEDYVVFPCGVICGALTRLGVKCRVTAEVIPQPETYKCSFNVQVIQS